MKYIKFDNHNISKLSLGTVQFGLDYGIANSDGKPLQKDVDKIIEYVSNNGINCFDTAQAYGNSEEVLGRSLKNIDEKIVISKFKSNIFRENLSENISISLKNLNLPSLFGLLLHDSDILYDWKNDDTKSVNQLIDSKKIKYFGVSIYTSRDFELAIENENIKFIQIPFNLFDQRAYKENWFEKAKKNNKLIFIRSIYLQGLLLMEKNKVPSNLKSAKKYLDILDKYCEKLKITRNELALSFVDTIAKDSLILFGCENITQAEENIKNYNSLKKLSQTTIENLSKDLSTVNEEIYNPTKW